MSNSIGLRLADLVGHLDLDSPEARAARDRRTAEQEKHLEARRARDSRRRAATVISQQQRDQTNARRRALRAQRESTS